jgi:hypothetical protein
MISPALNDWKEALASISLTNSLENEGNIFFIGSSILMFFNFCVCCYVKVV